MTTQARPSKNRRRKDRRSDYHAAVNALGSNPQDQDALDALAALLSRYCRQVDQQIDGIGAFAEELCGEDELHFIDGLLDQLESNGWVTIPTPHGDIQIKADINDYIRRRLAAGTRHGQIHSMVAESLHERAVQRIRPRYT